jgi:hypothetical protein
VCHEDKNGLEKLHAADCHGAAGFVCRRVDVGRWPGRSSFGVTMGIAVLSPARASFGPGTVQEVTGVNLGLQWRYTQDSNRRIDITAWRDVGRPSDALSLIQSQDAGYGARVEMLISGRGMPLVAERGFIGVQLDGGARISVKRSAGRPAGRWSTPATGSGRRQGRRRLRRLS